MLSGEYVHQVSTALPRSSHNDNELRAQVDSASQFTAASRADLAEKELREVELLETFLPPLLTELAVDETLKECITEAAISPSDNPGKSKGKLFKAFYDKVDKTLVDADLLKRRVDAILSQTATS